MKLIPYLNKVNITTFISSLIKPSGTVKKYLLEHEGLIKNNDKAKNNET